MKLSFATLDVFTGQRFSGNPLAVVFDADGLDDSRMQLIAREFGHPETVFVLKPIAGGTAKVRIFTPAVELPFAGHPTVGTALILALKGHAEAGNIVLEEKIGLVHCKTKCGGAALGAARFLLPQLPKPAGTAASPEAIAAAIGLSAEDIGADDIGPDTLMPSRWSAGNTFTFVPVRSRDALRRCRPNNAKWDEAFEVGGRSQAYVISGDTADPGNTFCARMFALRLGVTEDPATGSAAAALAGLCAQAMPLSDGEHWFGIEQGFEMGRGSHMELLVTMQNGKLVSASVGGMAVVVTEGTIEV
jgi:trans-2,3-dihydro-3-hydroxyanthranilate isomerase